MLRTRVYQICKYGGGMRGGGGGGKYRLVLKSLPQAKGSNTQPKAVEIPDVVDRWGKVQ